MQKQVVPLPLRLLYVLLALTYIVYVPVVLFRSNLFLLTLDLLLFVAICITATASRPATRVTQKSRTVPILVGLYLLGVAGSLLRSLPEIDGAGIATLRNLVFGMGVLYVAGTWIDRQTRINTVLSITVWGSVLTALYGLRQSVFGFAAFERERLSLMGASLAELEHLGRARLTSTFGDPLAFGVFMTLGAFAYLIARQQQIAGKVTRVAHPAAIGAIVLALILTLTRAPLLGLICGMGFVMFAGGGAVGRGGTGPGRIRLAALVGGVLACVYGLATSESLGASDSALARAVVNGAASVWSLVQMAAGSRLESEAYFLVNQSMEARAAAWAQALELLQQDPLGTVLTRSAAMPFSAQDVGLLKGALQAGVVGALALNALAVTVFMRGWRGVRRMTKPRERNQGLLLLGAWLSIQITNGITSILDSSVIAIPVWTLAAILLNQQAIAASGNVPLCKIDARRRQGQKT